MTTNVLANFKNQDPSKGPAKMGLLDTLSIAKKVFLDSTRKPTSRLPEVIPDYKSFQEPSESMKFIWFGHSTLLINLNSKNILIDPVFHHASPFSFLVKRFQTPVTDLGKLPEIHTILISHDHYDHLDKLTIEFFNHKKTTFIVPTGVGSHLVGWGITKDRITELNWHESTVESGIKYTAAPAQHFSGRGLFDRNATQWASWIIQHTEEKIYYSGDSGYGPHFKEIGKQYGPFNYAFIENGQYNTMWPDVHMQPEETLQALLDLDAHTLIPVHWGMFDLALHHWAEPIVRTYTIAMNWDIPIITPRLGEIVTENNRPLDAWWEPFLEEKKPAKLVQKLVPEIGTK